MAVFNEIFADKKTRKKNKFNKKCKGQDVLTSYMLSDVENDEVIVVPEGIKTIKAMAFINCPNLKKVILPTTLEKIEYSAFYGCTLLEEINIPDSVYYIEDYAFNECKSLKKVRLPKNLEKIENGVFSDCYQLKEIVIPDELKEIGCTSFYNCKNLEKIIFNKNLKFINISAFEGCESLEKLEFKGKIKEINMNAFRECKSLENVFISNNVEYVDESAFDSCPKLVIYNSTSEEILKYINSICKNKYENLKKLYNKNDDLRLIINYISTIYKTGDKKYNFEKFKKLFYKTRVLDVIPLEIFKNLSIEQIENFDYKLWKNIEKYIDIKKEDISFINIMNIFGLFEKDEDIERRKDLFIKLISNKNKNCLVSMDSNMTLDKYSDYFEKIIKKEYILKEGLDIPNEFFLYLDKIMPEEKVKKLKKINGTFGSHLNKFIKNKYDIKNVLAFKLKDNINENKRKEISKFIYENNLSNNLSKDKIKLLFEEIDPSYDKDFLDFLIKNLDLILLEIDNDYTLPLIKENFKDIIKFYLNNGKIKLNLYDCLKYLEVYKYKDASFGDERFIDFFHDSGASSDSFSFYKKQYQKLKTKYKTTLPNTDITFDYSKDEKIRIRRLPSNDPVQIFIGENNYTDCCQVYNDCAENCIIGISESPSMGVTIVELIKGESKILLAASLDWTRNGIYCHDNIEGTDFLDKHNNLGQAVLKAYKHQAKEILEKSKEQVFNYLEKEKRNISENEFNKLKEQAEKQIIKAVLIGDNFNDIDISSLQDLDYKISNIYSEYNCYSDSGYKKLLYGNLKELDKDYLTSEDEQIAFFKDDRNIYTFTASNITDEELLKISLIEKEDTHIESFASFCDKYQIDSSSCKVVIGEDWYLVYQIENNEVKIHDLKIGVLRDKNEKLRQLIEIKNIIYNLIDKSLIFDNQKVKKNTIKALVNKNNSHLLYLSSIDKGIINPLSSNDISKDILEVSFEASDKYIRKRTSKN